MSNATAPAPEATDRTDGPLHVAIIMDGNGRWAAARGLPRAEGHRRGVEALRRVVRAASELGILHLTIFSFSSENWSRPATEIGDLFGLLRRFIRNDLATLHRDGVRVRVIGERAGLDPDICALLNDDSTEVGQVHLGIVHVFELDSSQVTKRESVITQLGFLTPEELLARRGELETWSQICLDQLATLLATPRL